jgi:uncharacterized Tic20 family protein
MKKKKKKKTYRLLQTRTRICFHVINNIGFCEIHFDVSHFGVILVATFASFVLAISFFATFTDLIFFELAFTLDNTLSFELLCCRALQSCMEENRG